MGRLFLWLIIIVMAVAGGGFFYAADQADRAGPVIEQARPALERFEAEGLAWADLSPSQQAVLVQVEDPNFFAHRGLDVTTPGVGFTTLTMRVADELFPESAGSPNLARRAALAMEVDRLLSKEEQLTIVLNTAGLGAEGGRWLTGYPAAAQALFGADVATLTDAQFINLTARLLEPTFYGRAIGARALAERVRRIERLMAGLCAPATPWDVEYDACA